MCRAGQEMKAACRGRMRREARGRHGGGRKATVVKDVSTGLRRQRDGKGVRERDRVVSREGWVWQGKKGLLACYAISLCFVCV